MAKLKINTQLKDEVDKSLKMKSLHDYVKEEYLEEGGNAIIDIQLYEGLELFDPLSMGKQIDINPEIIDYIDRKSNLIPVTIPIVIRFHGRSLTTQQQDQVRACLEEHYSNALHDRCWDYRTNKREIIYLTILGVALIFIYLVCSITLDNPLFVEILGIFGSFAMWEAADCFILERVAIKNDLYSIAQNKTQTIEFYED